MYFQQINAASTMCFQQINVGGTMRFQQVNATDTMWQINAGGKMTFFQFSEHLFEYISTQFLQPPSIQNCT